MTQNIAHRLYTAAGCDTTAQVGVYCDQFQCGYACEKIGQWEMVLMMNNDGHTQTTVMMMIYSGQS